MTLSVLYKLSQCLASKNNSTWPLSGIILWSMQGLGPPEHGLNSSHLLLEENIGNRVQSYSRQQGQKNHGIHGLLFIINNLSNIFQ